MVMKISTQCVFLTSAAAITAITYVFEVRGATFQNIPITYQTLPNEVKVPMPSDTTVDQFKLRLKAGGTLTLINNETEISPIDPTKKTLSFIALDKLELLQGAKIITNGN